ncbi:sulfate transporter family protein [Bartonella sp. TP]|uniref:sulfate transporter family protein n=1 Tax=Bartonella sp. TP TaxID=3057550 RepID=UPI0025B0978B|nr:sulfate transporter family protein [Bartonella sp. TP]WJW80446.1 sulfate transporter family protein [Bartonella sp. TP]
MMPINILNCALRAVGKLFSPGMRNIFWRVLAITILCLAVCWFLFRHIFMLFAMPFIAGAFAPLSLAVGWLSFLAVLFFSLGLSFAFYFFLAPLTAFVGSFFADDAIAVIEQEDYPELAPGRAMNWQESFSFSLRFLAISIIGNIAALIMYFFTPIHIFSFYIVNGYILGRAYFIINAQRFHSYQEATALFNQHLSTIFICGLLIAFISSIPLLNLVAPLFAASFMAYIYKNITEARRQTKKIV